MCPAYCNLLVGLLGLLKELREHCSLFSISSHITIKNAFQLKANCLLVLTLTLVLKLDLGMVIIYHCAKKKVSITSASKVTAQTNTQNDTRQKHYLSAYMGGNKTHLNTEIMVAIVFHI